MKSSAAHLALALALLCASCQQRDASSVVASLDQSSRSHFGIDIEALGFIVSGPMVVQMDSRMLQNYKQDHPIDQLLASGYLTICKPRADRVMIGLTTKGEKLRSSFRKSKGPPAAGFMDSLGEPDCPPLKQ